MKQSRWISVIFALVAYGMVGCGESASSSSPQADTVPASHDHDHDHEGHDHDGHDHDHEGHDHSHDSAAAGTSAFSPEQFAEVEIPDKPQAAIAADAAPQQVVQAFLDSLRSGSEQVAGGLLTDKAWRETNREGLIVQPPGTPEAKYTVGDTRFVTDDQNGAHVTSTWTETFEEGVQESYEITWILRRETEGWRIAGMATTAAEGGETLFLNFEDPRDMLSKWQEADTEATAEDSAAYQAQNPNPSQPSLTR